jgi:hypothetical protein
MVGFTRELSCTDGSTDAYIFLPSVHPTLYKSVGPTCHNGWRLASSPNPIFSPAAARARLVTVRRRLLASGESLAYARLRPPPPPAIRARCRPPAPPLLAVSACAGCHTRARVSTASQFPTRRHRGDSSVCLEGCASKLLSTTAFSVLILMPW